MKYRSKRYKKSLEQVAEKNVYSPSEAIEKAKQISNEKFNASIEVHFRLGIDPKQTDQTVRAIVKLPHGTGKKKIIAAFVTPDKESEAKAAGADIAGGEELIKEIKKSEKLNFDVAVANPAMMKSLAPIAKILGTKGKMPSPKTGTVGPNIVQMIKDISGGKIDIKNDESGNLHQSIGRVSFGAKKLSENFDALLQAIRSAKPKGAQAEYIKSVTIVSSMGPGVKVKI